MHPLRYPTEVPFRGRSEGGTAVGMASQVESSQGCVYHMGNHI